MNPKTGLYPVSPLLKDIIRYKEVDKHPKKNVTEVKKNVTKTFKERLTGDRVLMPAKY